MGTGKNGDTLLFYILREKRGRAPFSVGTIHLRRGLIYQTLAGKIGTVLTEIVLKEKVACPLFYTFFIFSSRRRQSNLFR